jgi:hypothetical protein
MRPFPKQTSGQLPFPGSSIRAILFLGACVVAASSAQAETREGAGTQQDMEARFKARFAAADRNADGVLDRDEARALPRLHAAFDAVDTSRDGRISLDEVESAYRRALNQAYIEAAFPGELARPAGAPAEPAHPAVSASPEAQADTSSAAAVNRAARQAYYDDLLREQQDSPAQSGSGLDLGVTQGTGTLFKKDF